MGTVRLEGVVKAFGAHRAVDDVTLEIAAGQFVTLLGPSGCGKTTTLRAIAGLVMPDAGRIEIGGHDVTRVPVNRRNIGMVFQSHALFPHMTVERNVAFGLRMRNVGRDEQRTRVREALELVHLSEFGERYPHQMSGGQQQRVALARALVISPSVLLLDEPFGALDRKLREAMQVELRQLTRRLGITAVFVTHDQQEALVMSDRIAVMNAGRIEQVGPPVEIFDRPATRFVADFMGVENLLDARVLDTDSSGVRVATGEIEFAITEAPGRVAGERLTVALRAERVRIGDRHEPSAAASIEGRVEQATFFGAASSYRVRVDRSPDLVLVAVEPHARMHTAGPRRGAGDRVWVSWDPHAVHLIGAARP